jgi:hypothetical protein
MRFIADIEASGLYEEATKIHCAVFKDIDTGKVYRFTQKDKIIKVLEATTYLVMHNGIGYDIPLIKKLWGYEYKGRLLDTVLMSRELFKNTPIPEKMKEDYKKAGKKLDGPHSLAAWGYRLGRGKVEHEDWSTFTPAMMHRCSTDVELTHLLYLHIQEKLNPNTFPPRAVWLTMDFMECISRQEKHGWKLDIPRCERYVKQLDKWVGWIDKVLDPYVPVLPLIKEDRVDDSGESQGFQNPFTKAGSLNARLDKWIAKEAPTLESSTIGGPFCRITFRKVSLNSNKEVKEWLLDIGWQPEEYNYSKVERDEDGNPKRTGPKLSPDDMFFGIDGKVGRLLCKRVQCRHRQSNIQGWLERVRSDGRIESRVSGFADTYRVRHANIANVPNAESFFGKQMRRCFIAEEGMVLVSADAASCQDRMLIARARDAGIHDELFEEMILHGDKKKGTDSHTRAMQELNKVFEEEGLPLITRGGAKNFNYAYKFNAGNKKLGTMAGIVNEGRAKQLGEKLRAALDEVFKAQVELEKHLKKEWMKSAKMRTVKFKKNGREFERQEFYNGKVRGLDGRQVLIRNEKDILVFMLQSDEALTMAYATILMNRRLSQIAEEGVSWKQVCFYHDEVTVECSPHIAEEVKTIMENSIRDAGRHFKLAIEQQGEGAIGKDWYSVH